MFQICSSFFLALSTKEDILKNVGNQTVDSSHWLLLYFFHTIEVNGYRQLFGYQRSSKYLLLCSRDEKTHTALEQLENENDRICIFGWTVPLRIRGWHTFIVKYPFKCPQQHVPHFKSKSNNIQTSTSDYIQIWQGHDFEFIDSVDIIWTPHA